MVSMWIREEWCPPLFLLNDKEKTMALQMNSNTDNKVDWFSPLPILEPLGPFDLDPCTHKDRPWDTAAKHYTIEDDGLLLPWEGRVWMNPPYGRVLPTWMNRLALHGNGTALVYNRSDTPAFQDYVFPFATSILYIRGRVFFCDINGVPAKSSGGAPSVLIAYGENNADAIADSGIRGHHQYLKSNLLVIGISREPETWRLVVGDALKELDGKAKLDDIYETVLDLAPKRVRKNKHYKAKVRQILQMHFTRIDKGEYIN